MSQALVAQYNRHCVGLVCIDAGSGRYYQANIVWIELMKFPIVQIAQTRILVTATELHHDTTMIDNWNTRIRGDLVELVPYRRHFVKRYHEWMVGSDS